MSCCSFIMTFEGDGLTEFVAFWEENVKAITLAVDVVGDEVAFA